MFIRLHRIAFVPATALLSLALLAGCSDSDDDDTPPPPVTADTSMAEPPGMTTDMDPDTSPGTNPNMDPDPDPDGETAVDIDGNGDDDGLTSADIAGTWSTGCLLDDPEDPGSEYESASVSFAGDDFSFTGDSFSDAGCTESLGEAVAVEGTFALAGVVLTTEGLDTTELDLAVFEAGSTESVTVLALAYIDGDLLYFANGDLGELEDIVGQPRPDTLELDEPFMRLP